MSDPKATAPVERPPVVVLLHVEWPNDSRTEPCEIDRDAWDAMTPVERLEEVEMLASEHAGNHVSYGWHINDATDYRAVEQS